MSGRADWITEAARNVPVRCNYHVVVAGGGVSGICAAIAAARNGVRTLLVERYGFCGGNGAIYLPFLSFLDQHGEPVVKGIGKELIDRVEELGGGVGHGRDPLHVSYTPIDSEVFKRVALEKLKEAGVDLLLHTLIVDVQTNEDSVTHLLVENKSGRCGIAGKWFIDATGDADVAFRAGVPCLKGNEAGKMQPATLMFQMGGVDINRCRLAIAANPKRYGSDIIPPEHYLQNEKFIVVGMREALEEAKAAGRLHLDNNRVIFITQPRAGEVAVNMTRVHVDATDGEDLSNSEVKSRTDMWEVAAFLKEYVPGFADAYVMQSAHCLGIRESRRISGDYVLDRSDILNSRRFSDSIAVGSYPIDLHHPTGPDCTLEHPKEAYEIPYRSLIPQRASNLLVVGRCISTTHEALAAIRVMPTGMALGQAGGTAVALACQNQLGDVRHVDVQQLREQLVSAGAKVSVDDSNLRDEVAR